MDYEIYSISEICSLCLITADTIDLDGNSKKGPEIDSIIKRNLIKKISNCLQIKITHDDKLINLICKECTENINKFYEFKMKCKQSINEFRKQMKKYSSTLKIKMHHQSNKSNENHKDVKIVNDKSANVHNITSVPQSNSQPIEFETIIIENVDTIKVPIDDKCIIYDYNENIEAFTDMNLKKSEPNSSSTATEKDTTKYNQIDQNIVEEPIKDKPNKQKLDRIVGRNGKMEYRKMCTICGFMSLNIKLHMLTHTGEKRFQCKYCNKGFIQIGNYKHHLNIHTGERPYACKLCDKSFGDPHSLRAHIVQHTGERKYECKICNRRFSYSHILTAHQLIHTQDRKFHCTQCPQSFLVASSLKRHNRTHTGERPYKCEHCSKTFAASGTLATHRRIHDKDKRNISIMFHCERCKKSFSHRSSLTNHIRSCNKNI